MALSNIDKKHANELILAINNDNIDYNDLEIVKTNYMQYGKLKQIAKQMQKLKEEAFEIVKESQTQHMLQNVECKCKKISGNMYHLYSDTNGKNYLSMIAPTEWNNDFKHTYVNSFYYDYDKTFVNVDITHK